jgi:hypothetical protein
VKIYQIVNIAVPTTILANHRSIADINNKYTDRVIDLLEKGANFPSNIAEKVYERFTQDNMEKAQLKIVRELKAFGILRTSGTRK